MKQIVKTNQMVLLRAALHLHRRSVGFVPTMGALHRGHLELVRRSKKENDVTVVSIFVNPTQFGPKEDFSRYPRPLRQDLEKLRKLKVDFVFTPSRDEIYPEGYLKLKPKFPLKGKMIPISKPLCGKFRPGHFRGVAEVVGRLFETVRPDIAYFGAKDFQQSRLIQELVKEYHLPVQIQVCPTVREKDGLAMSSRNRYLNRKDRIRARAISRTLAWIRQQVESGRKDIDGLLKESRGKLIGSVDQVQYLEIVEEKTLRSVPAPKPQMVALAACFLGKTRLIDNVIIRPSKSR